MSPTLLALGVAVALGFAVLALVRPRVSLLTLVAFDVSNLNGVLADHLGFSPYRPQLALAVLVLVVLALTRRLRFAWSPVLLGLALLAGAFCLTFLNAADPVTSTALLASRGRDLFYAVVVLALLLSTHSLVLVVKTTVLVLAGLAGLTVLHEFVLHNQGNLGGLSEVPLVQEGGAATARHAGTSSDVNFWGRLLILFTPLALSLGAMALQARAAGRWTRWLWAGCGISLLLGIYLTQSRGGFIAVFLALVCWLALAGGWWRRSILALPVVLAVVVPVSGIGSRLLTLVTAAGGSAATEDMSVLTRKRLQLDAWEMFLDSPAVGHGIGSYGALFPDYDRLSNAYTPVNIVVAAHNFYLEQAADGGVVLLLAWLVLAGSIAFTALRARSLTTGTPELAHLKLLADGVLAGVLGWAVASVFLHLSDFRALLLMAVLAAALDIEARRRAVVAPTAVTATAAHPPRRRLVPALAAAAVVAVASAGLATTASETRYEVTATLAVVPVALVADGSQAYQVDVISRGSIVPTLTEVLRRAVTVRDLAAAGSAPGADVSISVTQSRLGGAVVVDVRGASAAEATAAGEQVLALARSTVASLNASYALTGELTGVTATRQWPPEAALAVVPPVLAGLLVWLARRRPSPPAPRRNQRGPSGPLTFGDLPMARLLRSSLSRSPRRALLSSALVAGLAVLVSAPVPPAPAVAATTRPFAASSPFNHVIPAAPALDPKSRAMVSGVAGSGRLYANLVAFGIPVYTATSTTPLYQIRCDMEGTWGSCPLSRRAMPIPLGATANSGDDGVLTVTEPATGTVGEYWRARRSGTGWAASWGAVNSLTGSGWGGSSTGAGASRLGGVVRVSEIERGVIPHALVLQSNNACAKIYRAPALKTDGASTRTDCIPEGARLQLDPSLNLDTLGLTKAERTVARAMQVYGAYLIDMSGTSLSVSFERAKDASPTSIGSVYRAAGLRWDYDALNRVPWQRMRVLERWQG